MDLIATAATTQGLHKDSVDLEFSEGNPGQDNPTIRLPDDDFEKQLFSSAPSSEQHGGADFQSSSRGNPPEPGEVCQGFTLSSVTGEIPKTLRLLEAGWTAGSRLGRVVCAQDCTGRKERNAKYCRACIRCRKSQLRKEQRVYDRVAKMTGKTNAGEVKQQVQWAPTTILNDLVKVAERAQKRSEELEKELGVIKSMYKGPLTNLMGRAEEFIPPNCFAHTYYRVSLSWIAHVCNTEERGTRSWRWDKVPGGKEFVEYFQTLRNLPHPKRMYDFLVGAGGQGSGRGSSNVADLTRYNLPAVPPEKTLQGLARKRFLKQMERDDNNSSNNVLQQQDGDVHNLDEILGGSEEHVDAQQQGNDPGTGAVHHVLSGDPLGVHSHQPQRHEDGSQSAQPQEHQRGPDTHESGEGLHGSGAENELMPRQVSARAHDREVSWVPPAPRPTDRYTEWVLVQRRKRTGEFQADQQLGKRDHLEDTQRQSKYAKYATDEDPSRV